MATFQDVNARLNELVPNGGDARAMDQTAVFASLADAQLCLRRTDPEVVRAAQRTLEDVLLRITCGGWAGPAVRRSASDVLSTLFSVGNPVAMYSCINEIMTHVTSPPERNSASKPDAGGGLTTQGRERIGALECVARLARGGHGAAMSGSAGGFVAAVAKLLKSTDGTSASSGKTFPNAWALTEDGARSLRRCAIRSLAAVVGAASRERPLRAETRTAAARVVNDAIAHGLTRQLNSRREDSSKDLAKDLEDAAERSGHSCAREAAALAELTGDRERLIPGAGRTVQAAACTAARALASTPGGSGLWNDRGGGGDRSSSKGSNKQSAGEEMRDLLHRALRDGDEEARGCAASALGQLAASRLCPSEHTHAGGRADGGVNGGGVNDDGGLDATPDKSGNAKKTHHRRSSSSFSGTGGSTGLFGNLMRSKSGDAESMAAVAAAQAAASVAAANAPLDLESPGSATLWGETIDTCFANAFKRACRVPGPDGRRTRLGLAASWVHFTAFASEKSLESGKSIPAALLISSAGKLYGALGAAAYGSGGMAREDVPHAEACALHVLRCGILARLDEGGRGSLLRELAKIAGASVEGENGTAVRENTPPAAVAMRALAAAVAAAGRVDDDTAEALTNVTFDVLDAGTCPDDVATCVRALAAAAPARAAGLLRRAVFKMSDAAGSDVGMDAGAVAGVAGGAACAAALCAAGDVLPLGLPGGLLRDAAAAAFALGVGVVNVNVDDGGDGACHVRARGLRAAAGALRGPAGRLECEQRGDEIVAALTKALDIDALRAAIVREGDGDEAGSAVKGSAGAFGFMTSTAKKKRRPAVRWPPARELSWRAAAVDLLAAYARRSACVDREILELLESAVRCSLINTGVFEKSLNNDEDGAGHVAVNDWPTEPGIASALATFRLATLRAFGAVPGGASAYASSHRSLVALCASPVRPLPGSNLGSSCVGALRLALDQHGDPADTALGPWTSGGDAALDELRAFDGGWDSPAAGFDGDDFLHIANSSVGGSFPRHTGLAATLQAARLATLARVAAVADDAIRTTAMRALELEAGIDPNDSAGDSSSLKAAASSTSATPTKALFNGKSTAQGWSGGASPASLVNVCVAALALAGVKTFESKESKETVASSLTRLASAVGNSPASGPAHWRAAAELDARAAELVGDAASSSLLTRLATTLPDTPPRLRRGPPKSGEGYSSANSSLIGGGGRAVAAATCASTFRRAGALASTAAMRPLVKSLVATSVQIDVGSDATHLWSLHALGIVAHESGPGFRRHVNTACSLAFALMNSPECAHASSASATRAACGRLVNAAVAAVGPDLDPGGKDFARFAALVSAIQTGGESGAGSYSDTQDGDAGCQLEAALFLQQLALFAPQTAPPDRLVRRLRPYLSAKTPGLRRVAAATLRHVCERDAGAVLRCSADTVGSDAGGYGTSHGGYGTSHGGGLEADLLALLDGYGEVDAKTASDATRALWLLTRANALDDPAKAAKRLAAVALHAPGQDWGGNDVDVTAAEDAGAGERDEGEGDENADRKQKFRELSGRSAPKLSTRVVAAAMMSAIPKLVSNHPAHFDLALARSSLGNKWLVSVAHAIVDLGYKLATCSVESLRPRGLAMLTNLVCVLGESKDPDVPGSSLLEQFQAQVLSALRAAVPDHTTNSFQDSPDDPSTPPNPIADPACIVEGMALAGEALTNNRVTGGDAGAVRRIVDFIARPAVAWLEDANGSGMSKQSESTRSRLFSALRDESECAEGITCRVRIATLRACAVAAVHAPDALFAKFPEGASVELGSQWAALTTRSPTLVGADLVTRSAVARDLARAAGPTLEALASTSLSSKGTDGSSETRRAVIDACADCLNAAVDGSMALNAHTNADDDDAAVMEELFEPLNPPPGAGDGSGGDEVVARGGDVVSATRALRLALEDDSTSMDSSAVNATSLVAAVVAKTKSIRGDDAFIRESVRLLASSLNIAIARGGSGPPISTVSTVSNEWTVATAALGAALASGAPSPANGSAFVSLERLFVATSAPVREDLLCAPFLALATRAAVNDGVQEAIPLLSAAMRRCPADLGKLAAKQILTKAASTATSGSLTASLASAAVVAAAAYGVDVSPDASDVVDAIVGDARADASVAAAALATCRLNVLTVAADDVNGAERARAFLRRHGAACASGTRARCSLAAAAAATDDVTRGAHAVAAAEGLKLWTAAVHLGRGDLEAEAELVSVFLPLVMDAGGGCVGVGYAPVPALRAAAAKLVQMVAGVAPDGFRAAVSALGDESKRRLQSALATGPGLASAPGGLAPPGTPPAISLGSRG